MQTQTEQMAPQNIGYHEALGMMMWLMKHADYHNQWPLWSVDTDIVPALMHGQSKLYFDEEQNPIGFVTWAWLDDDAKAQVLENTCPLEIEQWQSGNHLMVADFVAPWGHGRLIVNDLKLNVFPENRVLSLGRHTDGSIRKIYHWKGIRFKEPITEEQRALNKTLWAKQARQ
jgi:cytolysin-activating lysine-acyltransferase